MSLLRPQKTSKLTTKSRTNDRVEGMILVSLACELVNRVDNASSSAHHLA